MALTAKLYGSAMLNFVNGTFDWAGGTSKVLLLTSAYAPDLDVHAVLADVQASEVVGTGYVAGGIDLAAKTATYDAATNTMKLDAGDPEFPACSVIARYAAFYNVTGNKLVCLWDFGIDVTSTAEVFTLTLDPGGLVTVTTP